MFFSNDPKMPFYVGNELSVDNTQQKILIKLYQPLVGAVAASVYLTLSQQFSHIPIRSEFMRLHQLEEILDIDLKSLFNALHKLEAVSLITTKLQQNSVLGEVLIFELKPVLSPAEFFATFLLSSLLLEKVGEPSFKRLQENFVPREFADLRTGKDVSAGFFDVFHMAEQTVINPPTAVQAAAKVFDNNANISEEQDVVKTDSLKLQQLIDWDYLIELFDSYHIDKKEIDRYRKQISDMINFYQLSELEFVQLATLSITAGDSTLNIKKIEQLINENYDDLTKGSGKSRELVQVEPATENVKKMIAGLSEQDQETLRQVNGIRPLDYLYRIKKQKGGYVTTAEKQIVYQLKQKNGLKDDLINVLLLVTLEMAPTLSKPLVDRIANDWLQNGVVTAVQALNYVHERDKSKAQKRKGHSYNSYNGSKKKEVATDWSKKTATGESKLTETELNRLLKNLDQE